jgi:hypothetical protein
MEATVTVAGFCQRITSIRTECPGVAARGASQVTNRASRASASATYIASYTVRLSRSSHARRRKSVCEWRRTLKCARSSSASWAGQGPAAAPGRAAGAPARPPHPANVVCASHRRHETVAPRLVIRVQSEGSTLSAPRRRRRSRRIALLTDHDRRPRLQRQPPPAVKPVQHLVPCRKGGETPHFREEIVRERLPRGCRASL